MDPIRNLCIVKDSFEEKNINKIPKYTEILIGSPRAIRKSLIENKNKKEIVTDEIILPLKISDPYLKINSFFQKRSSLILANLDTHFNFSRQEDGYILPQVINRNYKYAILDGDKGFLEYLQYRLPASTGFIDCLNIDKNDKITTQFLNQNRAKSLSDYVLGIYPEGLNLVVSNKVLSKDTLLEGLKICDTNATFITKINTNTPIEYMYGLSMWFKSVTLIKPFLENLNSKDSYLVAEGFSGNSLDAETFDFLKIGVPDSFYNYVQNYYNTIKILKEILPRNTKYNMYKCKAILNLF